jgi:hypothetical protein
MKGYLKLWGSKSPSQTVTTKRVGNIAKVCPTGGKFHMETLNHQLQLVYLLQFIEDIRK